MPAEGGVLHPNVQPGNVDARDVLPSWELHEGVELVGQVVEVPWVVKVLRLLLIDDLLTWSAEARTVLGSGHVGCVLNQGDLTLAVVDFVPVFFF